MFKKIKTINCSEDRSSLQCAAFLPISVVEKKHSTNNMT